MKSLLLLLLATTALAATPDQVARWNAAKLNPKDSIRLDKAVFLYQRTENRYQSAANMRPGTIPPVVIFCLHMREADNNFRTNLGQGDSLLHRTVHVPRGRIPNVEPPYTWEQAAQDALFVTDHMDKHDWTHIQSALDTAESYNGFGYRRYGIPSPYLFSGTSVYKRGKFSGDGHFSPTMVDQQLGCVAVWKKMQQHGIVIPFAP